VVWCGAVQCRQVSYVVESMGQSTLNVSVFINTFFFPLCVAINIVLHILYTLISNQHNTILIRPNLYFIKII